MLALYMLPIVPISLGFIESPFILVMLYSISGFGMAGIGMGVMHDANHGSYSKSTGVNRLMSFTLDFLGCNSDVWKLQHNVLHHSFTNIAGHDEDISSPMMLRFSPHEKKYWLHRFQHYYVWIFYGVLTLYWVTFKDFVKFIGYRKKGLLPDPKVYRTIMAKMIFFKLIYFTYALVIPMLIAPFSAWWVVLGFVCMHVISGVLLSVVFQLAHVVPNMAYPMPNVENDMNSNWHIHQMESTSNFSPNNRVLQWYFGGLTHQIEHHLFPHICHVHYRVIGKMVAITAKEHKVPYHVNRTFGLAVWRHIKTLRLLGRLETGFIPASA